MSSVEARRAVTLTPWPHFSEEEMEAARLALASGKVNYWTGSECRTFETEFASSIGTRYGIALANGTLALEGALLALGVGPGDDVVTTPRSFFASAGSVVTAGARPIFADVDVESGTITAESIQQVLTPRTKAIIVVHLAGWPCQMGEIMNLATSKGVRVIEDCAQAHGATVDGLSVGSFGDVAAWSFCQDKIMTTAGEGGMITTSNDSIHQFIWSYKDHGKDIHLSRLEATEPGFRWLHESFGSNWRLTEIQAAIGRVQLKKLPEWVERRRRNARRIIANLSEFDALRFPEQPQGHAYYKLYGYVRPELLKAGWSRDRILARMAELGAPAYSGSCSEIYLEQAFQKAGLAPAKRLPIARQLGETAMMFLVHPTLSDEQLDLVCELSAVALAEASR